MSTLPAPVIDDVNRPFWDGLDAGTLLYQHCVNGHRWLPARTHCPHCLSDEVEWAPASGRAVLVSWVVYRHAFDASFAERLPYNVALVELREGPRLLTNVVGADGERPLAADMPLRLAIQREGDVSLARFRPE